MDNYSNINKKQKAIALVHDQESTQAPKVIASGQGLVAQKIIEIAHSNNIPIYEDQELAQILSLLEVGSYIQPEVYCLVAEILSYLYYKNNQLKSKI